MKSKFMKLLFAFLFVLLTTGIIQAQNVLIWDNDNDSHYNDPDNGMLRSCEYGIQQALSANGVSYTTVTTLPNNLSSYDIVFVVLGIYCVG